SFTWTAWVYLDNKTSDSTLFGKRGGYELTIRGGDLKIVSWGDDWFPAYNAPEKKWIHISVTGNSAGTNREIYINGSLKASGGPDYAISSSSNPLQIGHWPDQDGNGINGTIDDVRIYNRSLSEEEIQAIYRYDGGGTAQGDLIQITQNSGSFLVPFTHEGINTIERRESLVKDRSFLQQSKPSFGFFMPETPEVNLIYEFNQYVKYFRSSYPTDNQQTRDFRCRPGA
ncbi:MAG: LamG domain-containing protein, partial [Candidatus Aenigmatarchaeota archaeon]